jgi:hypothetical protein
VEAHADLLSFVSDALTALALRDWPGSLGTGRAGIAGGLIVLAWVPVPLKRLGLAVLRLSL